jgi:hypothetical protein
MLSWLFLSCLLACVFAVGCIPFHYFLISADEDLDGCGVESIGKPFKALLSLHLGNVGLNAPGLDFSARTEIGHGIGSIGSLPLQFTRPAAANGRTGVAHDYWDLAVGKVYARFTRHGRRRTWGQLTLPVVAAASQQGACVICVNRRKSRRSRTISIGSHFLLANGQEYFETFPHVLGQCVVVGEVSCGHCGRCSKHDKACFVSSRGHQHQVAGERH